MKKNMTREFTFTKTFMRTVKVQFGGAAALLPEILQGLKPDKIFLICDTVIDELYADSIVEELSKNYPTYKLIHANGEANKNWTELGKIAESFFAHGGTGKSCIIALGGGITGNMAGLFASLVFRGISLIHVPTTLLSQVDSAADVKQSINSGSIKNVIGSYKAPDAVVVDSSFLASLDDRELRAGFGEAIKHGFAQDMSFAQYIVDLEDRRSPQALEYIASRAIELKIEHWRNTPTMWNDKQKIERLTHLGHTVGKILEMIHVDYLSHGEAISHGMIIEAYASFLLGYLDESAVEQVYKMLTDLDLLYPLSDEYSVDSIVDSLYRNNQTPQFAFLKELGNPDTVSVHADSDTMRSAATWYFNLMSGKDT